MSTVLLDQLDRIAVSIEMPRGTVIFRAGQQCFGVFIVRRGKVALRIPAAPKVIPMDCAGPGAILGLAGALTGTYTVSARAVEDSLLGFVTVELMKEILDSQPPLSRDVLELVAHEIRSIRLAIADADGLLGCGVVEAE